MAALAIVAAVAASIVVSNPADAVPVPWKNCGTPGNPIQVQQFDAAVWPPQRGMPETVRYSFAVARDIDVGFDQLTVSPPPPDRVKFPVKGFLAPFLAHKFNVGPHSETVSFNVPSSIPPGTVFSVHLSIFDRGGTLAFCLDLSIPVK